MDALQNAEDIGDDADLDTTPHYIDVDGIPTGNETTRDVGRETLSRELRTGQASARAAGLFSRARSATTDPTARTNERGGKRTSAPAGVAAASVLRPQCGCGFSSNLGLSAGETGDVSWAGSSCFNSPLTVPPSATTSLP